MDSYGGRYRVIIPSLHNRVSHDGSCCPQELFLNRETFTLTYNHKPRLQEMPSASLIPRYTSQDYATPHPTHSHSSFNPLHRPVQTSTILNHLSRPVSVMKLGDRAYKGSNCSKARYADWIPPSLSRLLRAFSSIFMADLVRAHQP